MTNPEKIRREPLQQSQLGSTRNTSAFSWSRMDRVTRSSSVKGRREYIPGVSMTSYSRPIHRALPRLTSTVVLG
jgi:hypothetical protein